MRREFQRICIAKNALPVILYQALAHTPAIDSLIHHRHVRRPSRNKSDKHCGGTGCDPVSNSMRRGFQRICIAKNALPVILYQTFAHTPVIDSLIHHRHTRRRSRTCSENPLCERNKLRNVAFSRPGKYRLRQRGTHHRYTHGPIPSQHHDCGTGQF